MDSHSFGEFGFTHEELSGDYTEKELEQKRWYILQGLDIANLWAYRLGINDEAFVYLDRIDQDILLTEIGATDEERSKVYNKRFMRDYGVNDNSSY